MIAILYASNRDERADFVLASLERHGIKYRFYDDRGWPGFGVKLQTAYRAAKEFTDEHILFLDAYDVVALAGPDRILDTFKTFRHPWVVGAEPNIWPPGSFKPEDYPGSDSPWRFLNSGMYMVEREYLIECFDRWGEPELGVDDQYWLAEKFLLEPGCITLDTNCELFQNMIGGWAHFKISQGYLHNWETHTEPILLHHNGGGNLLEDERVAGLW